MDKLDKLLDEIGFTPGPWESDFSDRHIDIIAPMGGDDYGVIAEAANNGHDAKLISQSREMLKALILDVYGIGEIIGNTPLVDTPLCKQAKTVIEAATGWAWPQIVKWIEENG